VEIVTTAFCITGYWRTGNPRMARRPITKIARLTTIARTGRRMKMSVKFIGDAYC